jgi:hypothetical protein
MAKIISMRLTDSEEARVRGAAALTGLSTSAYLKWLLVNGKNADQNHNELVLQRLEELGIGIAKLLSNGRQAAPAPMQAQAIDKAEIVRGLRDRGVPSSTIRQVEAVLDEVANASTKRGCLQM